MSEPPVYTPLESYLLTQSVIKSGVDNASFARISEQLRNNGIVKGDDTYNSTRLGAEALQQQFFRLFGEELRGETEAPPADATTANATTTTTATATPAPTSPTSKKRKLGGPPLPTLKDVAENLSKVTSLVQRLYKRYQDDIIRKIKEDEGAYDQVQKAIQVIEKNENLRLAAKNNAQNAAGAPATAPTLAPREIKPVAGATGSTAGLTLPPGVKRPTSTTPIVPPKPPTPNMVPPVQFPQGASPVVRPPSTGVPQNAGAAVLQPPAGVTQPPPSGVLQPPVQPPKVSISPRPDASSQAKTPNAPPQQTTGPGQMQLKWDNPYQPPVPSQVTPSRQYQSPGPPKTPIPPPQQRPPQVQQQQWQNQQGQIAQGVQPPAVPTPAMNAQAVGKPLLVPSQQAGHIVAPQNAGNVIPQPQPQAVRPHGVPASPSPQPRPSTHSPAPHPTPTHRPIQPQQGQTPQPRPIVPSPTPPPGATGVIAPPQRWQPPPNQKPHQGQQQQPPMPGTPTPASSQKPGPYGSQQQPRPPIPEHMIRHAAAGTPLPPRRSSSVPMPPQTPVQSTPQSMLRGIMTAWGPQATPSTPGGTLLGEALSPAYDPVSPPQKPVAFPQATPTVAKKPLTKATPAAESRPASARGTRGRPRGSLRGRRPSATPSAGPSATRRSQSIISQTDELSMDHIQTTTEVKNEEATPRPHEETGDTTADESVSGRGNVTTPGSMRILKRKRPETPAEPPGPPTQVVWTRGFTKVSSSALDQISSHRDANMFATGVRERDAPNYRQIVLQPQDITSIRAAIKQGNKAAVAAAMSLPSGDPGTASVWLPISEDLVPPKGIVNSAQLERELVHMFCNAIMYNPDPYRGPGQTFVQQSPDDEEEASGYQFDENGVVRNTQSMFLEVEKLLGDLRSAEKERTARPLSTPRLTSTAAATPTAAADDTADDEDELAGDGGEGGSGAFKRRRGRN